MEHMHLKNNEKFFRVLKLNQNTFNAISGCNFHIRLVTGRLTENYKYRMHLSSSGM